MYSLCVWVILAKYSASFFLLKTQNINKVDVQFPHMFVRKLHTQAYKIVAGTKRKLCKKFQVDICKTKIDRSAHLVVEIQAMIYNGAMVRRLFTKCQVNTCKTKKDRSAHAQLRQAMIYNAARIRRLSTKLQVDTCKTKKDRSAHAQLHTL